MKYTVKGRPGPYNGMGVAPILVEEVEADWYEVDEFQNLVFYKKDRGSAEACATYAPGVWGSVRG